MKKIALLLASLLIVVGVNAQTKGGVAFREGTLAELQKMAEKENKPILIDAYASWCGPCVTMAKNVFPNAEVGKYVNATFIPAKFDIEKGEGVDVRKKYNVNSMPTFLILNSKGQEIGRFMGGSSAVDFIARLKAEMAKINK